MEKENKTMFIEGKNLRFLELDDNLYFSAIDVIEILTDSLSPQKYWQVLKKREPHLFGWRLEKMVAKDGRQRFTIVVNLKGVLQMNWLIESSKAESFKIAFAQAVNQNLYWNNHRSVESQLDRTKEVYKTKGYSDEWVEIRLKSIEARKEFNEEQN